MERAIDAAQRPGQVPAAAGEKKRYLPLDSMRGFVMLVLVSNGLGLGFLANHPTYGFLARQFGKHLKWEGLIAWELIMPAFMFMMGTALPFAAAGRKARGVTFPQDLRHTVRRVAIMILFGQFLTTLRRGRYSYEPYETLTTLATSYFCAYLICHLGFRWQAVSAGSLMLLNWALYNLFPGSEGPFSPMDNIGVVIDRVVFQLNHAGSWATINFLGSSVTVLFGAWAGALLMRPDPASWKLKRLAAGAGASFALALLLTPFNPVIHKAWTASFTFWTAGVVVLFLMGFVWLFDYQGYRRPAFPFVVVGMNSIFIYMLWGTLGKWINQSLGIFTLKFAFVGDLAPVVQACAVLFIHWCVCYWLYRRKIFFKI